MIISALLFFGLQGQMGNEDARFQAALAVSARGELEIVERLKSLRTAAEKLPANWKASSFKSGNGEMRSLTKQSLLDEISQMELTAAERWALIVENTATIDSPTSNLNARSAEMRRQAQALPQMHLAINQDIDAFNRSFKDGIMMNLATRLAE